MRISFVALILVLISPFCRADEMCIQLCRQAWGGVKLTSQQFSFYVGKVCNHPAVLGAVNRRETTRKQIEGDGERSRQGLTLSHKIAAEFDRERLLYQSWIQIFSKCNESPTATLACADLEVDLPAVLAEMNSKIDEYSKESAALGTEGAKLAFAALSALNQDIRNGTQRLIEGGK